MTSRFRLDAVALGTTQGEVRYEFPADLTVLAGNTGVGKTTLLEMIKHALGGTARLAPVAEQYVNDVTVDISIGAERLRISRGIAPARRGTARVTDLITGERLPDHHLDQSQPSLNTLLMKALDLPDDMRAAARTRSSTNAGARITFNDLLSFMYVPQYEINRDIASSQDGYMAPKRKAVFELLFALTNARILAMRSALNELNAQVDKAEKEHATVLAFLRDSNTASRIEAESAAAAAEEAHRAALTDQAALRQAIDPVTDRETQALRDLLTEAERGLADARAAVTTLIRQQAAYTRERRRVQTDLSRLHRMRDAGERLANIEFTVCPRCLQSLNDPGRDVPEGRCRVCLQPDPVTTPDGTELYEARQLAEQLAELDDQLYALSHQLTATTQAVGDREELVQSLSGKLDARTAERITPHLQAFSDAVTRLASADTQLQQLETVLRQWDRADDLKATAEQLRARRESLRTDITASQTNLDARRREIIGELNEEFGATVAALGIPGVQAATIHPSTYLPLLNGKPFEAFSSGGGIITATQVAYWVSLLTVAGRRGDTYYPGFLLIDSPRLALNTAETLAAALYRRLVTQADSGEGKVQLIIADNELPPEYRRDYDQIDFSYRKPTVGTIPHPGPSAVTTITAAANPRQSR